MSSSRREQLAASVLAAAGIRRSPKVTARTQLGRLAPEARAAGRQRLAELWGGYRGKDVTASKTRYRIARERKRAAVEASQPRPEPAAAPAGGFGAWLSGVEGSTVEGVPAGAVADAVEAAPAAPAAGGGFGAWLSGSEGGGDVVEVVEGPGGGQGMFGDRVVNFSEPTDREGHFSGPGFDTLDELDEWMEDEELHWVAEMAFDGEEWHAWFPDETP